MNDEMIKCDECGNDVVDGVCTSCGKQMTAPQNEAPVEEVSMETSPEESTEETM